MKVELYAPFLLHRRRSIKNALTGALDASPVQVDRLAFDSHTSSIQRLTARSHEEVIQVAAGVEARVWVNDIGVGSLFIRVDVSDRDELHALEAHLLPAVNGGLADFCARVDQQQSGDLVGSRSSHLGHSKVLWWHRILLLPDGDAPRALRLFGSEFQVSETTFGIVANGFTSISSDDGHVDEDELREVATGLVTATEEWIVIDELSRELTSLLLTDEPERNASHDGALGQIVDRARHLTGEVALASLLIDERRRHMANSSLRVHLAAAACWRLENARESLVDRAESIQALVRMDQQVVSAAVDEDRNKILVGFTVVTVLQSLMLIVEFAVGEQLTLLSFFRLGVSVLMFVATIYVLARFVAQGAGGQADALSAAAPRARWLPRYGR